MSDKEIEIDINKKNKAATIDTYLSDSTYLGGTISATDGIFVLESKPMVYQLILRHMLIRSIRLRADL